MGSGFRTFTAGEVLTASNVQNYLQDQVVMTFAGSAARSSAIGTANFEEGMTSYLTDTDRLEVYNGTNWVSVAPTSTQGLTLINTTSFSGVSSISLAANTFTSTYKNYKIILTGTASSADSNALQIRGRVSGTDNTTSNWFNFIYERSNSAGGNAYGASGSFGYAGAIANSGWSAVVDILDPQASAPTHVLSTSVARGTNSSIAYWFASFFNASTSFDSATFYGFSGTISGQYSVYGYNA